MQGNEPGTRGRVVLRVGFGPASFAAMQAAVNLAKAFDSDIEGEFIEDSRIAAASALSCTRVVSSYGRRSWGAGEYDFAREIGALRAAVSRRLREMAANAHIRFSLEPGAQSAPSFMVLSEPREDQLRESLAAFLKARDGGRGVIITGPNARMQAGPIAAIIEGPGVGLHVLSVAQRIAAAIGAPVVAMPFCQEWASVRAVEEDLIRLGEGRPNSFYRDLLPCGDDLALALHRLGAGIAVASFGGAFLPDEGRVLQAARLFDVPILLLPPAREV